MDIFTGDIPGSSSWTSISYVDKGWSTDRKFHVMTKKGEHLLLRLSSQDTYEQKRQEYSFVQMLEKLSFPMTKGIAFGRCQEGVYMLMEWLEGEPMEEALDQLSDDQAYKLGLEAGRILRSIHNIAYDGQPFVWEERFNKKIDRNLKMYSDCPLKYDKGQCILDYIASNRHLLNNRPLVYHHGDYHVGNMVFTISGEVGIIDFNRYDIGDPWEEFNRIVWDVQKSPYFATGRLDGYFDDRVPRDFFALLALYIASNTLASLPWARGFGEEDVKTMLDQAKEIIAYYDEFKNPIPRWYTEVKKELLEHN